MSSALKQKRLSFSEKIFEFWQSDNIGVCTVVEKVKIVDSVSNKD
jgi:hypothetical protein